jgi:ElaB/YqjD/DUF883 family membrane-anchored ribosome-binding protein
MPNTTHNKRGSSNAVASISDNIDEVRTATRKMANDSVEALRDTANQYLDEGKMRVRELSDTVQHRVQDQPITSILVASAVGFLLGVLWVRR